MVGGNNKKSSVPVSARTEKKIKNVKIDKQINDNEKNKKIVDLEYVKLKR